MLWLIGESARSVKIGGQWKFLNPNEAQKRKIPNQEGRWYISWRTGNKKEWQRADSWTHAMSLKLKKEAELHAIAAGVALPTPDPARLTIEDAVAQFKEDLTMLDRKDQTLGAYDLVFDGFRSSCKKRWLDEIERRDLLQYAQKMRKDGLSPRTVSNRWLAFMTFLKHFKITGRSSIDFFGADLGCQSHINSAPQRMFASE